MAGERGQGGTGIVLTVSGAAIRAGAGTRPGADRLLVARERARAEGGELLLVLRSAPVLRIFALTDVDRLIPLFQVWTKLSRRCLPTGECRQVVWPH
jgi:hypothetical protein